MMWRMTRSINAKRNLTPDIPEAAEAPAGWLEFLDHSEAQIAAGQTVPLAPVLDLMRASIARMEAKRTGTDKK